MAGELGTLSQYHVSDAARLRREGATAPGGSCPARSARKLAAMAAPWFVPDAACGCRSGGYPTLRPPDGRDGRGQRARRPGLRAADRGGTDPGTAVPRCRDAGPSRVGDRQPAAGRPGPDHAQSGSGARRADGLSAAGQRRGGSGDSHEPVRARAGRDRRSHRRASGAAWATQAIWRTAHSTPKHCRPHPGKPIAQPNAPGQGRYHPHRSRRGRCTNRPEVPPRRRTAPLTPTRTPSPNRLPATATASPTPAPSATPSHAAPGDAGRQQTTTPQARPTATAGRNTPQATPVGTWSNCNLPRSRPGCDFARPWPAATAPRSRTRLRLPRSRTRRDFTRSRPGCDFARTRTHLSGPRIGFAPWSLARAARLTATSERPTARVKQATRTAGG